MSGAVIYGVQPVLEALKAGRKIATLYLARTGSGATRRLISEAKAQGAKVMEVEKAELVRQAGSDRHQGVVAVLDAEEVAPDAEVDDILALAEEEGEPPLVLVLDGIQDPRNLGALIRSAWALGAHGVVIPKQRAAPVTAVAVKASAGATAHLPIVRVVNVKHALDRLKEVGVWSAAAALDGDPVERCRLDGPLAIVVGSEDKGVRPSVAEACDLRVRIELEREFDSLNASVAGGILLYEAQRQRRAGQRA
jgi:23S rRNA (guanosine2251-2'-O)-methyltransferase